ncbi:hypothetical protein GALL_347880 [mine drainage metagenome]|uniref:Uncharacterized protein n=1 Tax=mine drainage metagenome TaxID=410659 RepID=A0A1J5R103_9ZZZZ
MSSGRSGASGRADCGGRDSRRAESAAPRSGRSPAGRYGPPRSERSPAGRYGARSGRCGHHARNAHRQDGTAHARNAHRQDGTAHARNAAVHHARDAAVHHARDAAVHHARDAHRQDGTAHARNAHRQDGTAHARNAAVHHARNAAVHHARNAHRQDGTAHARNRCQRCGSGQRRPHPPSAVASYRCPLVLSSSNCRLNHLIPMRDDLRTRVPFTCRDETRDSRVKQKEPPRWGGSF